MRAISAIRASPLRSSSRSWSRRGGSAARPGAASMIMRQAPRSRLPPEPRLRTVAMLANEAADTALHNVATKEAIDLAMIKGTNYPKGPLAWADAIGPATILAVLDNLARSYGEDRYRASSLLRRVAARGGRF